MNGHIGGFISQISLYGEPIFNIGETANRRCEAASPVIRGIEKIQIPKKSITLIEKINKKGFLTNIQIFDIFNIKLAIKICLL